jgi:hypothetical protein
MNLGRLRRASSLKLAPQSIPHALAVRRLAFCAVEFGADVCLRGARDSTAGAQGALISLPSEYVIVRDERDQ